MRRLELVCYVISEILLGFFLWGFIDQLLTTWTVL